MVGALALVAVMFFGFGGLVGWFVRDVTFRAEDERDRLEQERRAVARRNRGEE